jgi:cation diffusion facilitator family transporter
MPATGRHPPVFGPLDARRERAARRITLAGLAVNVLLTGFKFVAGYLGHSQAVVADGVHSLSDMFTDMMVLVGARYWFRPADEEHPYGHRRIETVTTGFIGLSLAAAGAWLAYEALVTLPELHDEPPGWVAFSAAALAIVAKEILYRLTVATGRRIRSAALAANAWHHRSDALSSIPVALAVAGAALNPSWIFLDHVGTVVVAVFIFQASWRILTPVLRELVDAGAPAEARERITTVARGTAGVRLVHAVRTRYVGSGLQVDLHIKVDPGISVREGHSISEEVQQRLIDEGPDIFDVVVHTEPYEGPEEEDDG